jgi:hypothetical protein
MVVPQGERQRENDEEVAEPWQVVAPQRLISSG